MAPPAQPTSGTPRPRRGVLGWWDGLHPKARQQHLEMFMGIFGVFTAVALVTALVAEVKGEPAVKEVLVLLLFGIPLGFVVRAWRRY